jgi:hypothetical protein
MVEYLLRKYDSERVSQSKTHFIHTGECIDGAGLIKPPSGTTFVAKGANPLP